MPAFPLLYTYRRCPFAMRARMALLQAGIAFDAHEIVLRNKPAALLACSPKGTVPVLQLPGGAVLEQSLDIMRWAWQSVGDPGGWWARGQSGANLALLADCDGDFKRLLDRYKYPEGFADGTREAARDAARALLLLPLEARLQRHSHLGGEVPCAADLAIFPFVRQFAAVDSRWFEQQALPALQRWLAQWLGDGLFEAAMVKLPATGNLPAPRFPAP